jgi:hypothetical protein
MKSLKHFAYAFLYLFTFVIMLYFINNTDYQRHQLTDMESWFVSLITLANAVMGGVHLCLMFNAAFYPPKPTTYEDFIP